MRMNHRSDRFRSIALTLGLAAFTALNTSLAAEPAIAAYRWPNGTANLDAFAKWLGRDTAWGEDFIGSESWDNVQWPTWWLETWGKWVSQKPGRRLILGVPLLPGPVDGSGPKQGNIDLSKPVSLERGAAGEYNHHFKQLAENLVKYRLADSILRLGWEFNGDWYTWRAKGKEKLFAQYWQQIVKTMRAVPGTEKLQFCWNPTLGDQQFPAEQAWPGAEFVDYIGVDVYDETWNADTYPFPAGASSEEITKRQTKVWDEWLMGSKWGLAFWSKFAREQGKPLAIPEWGVNKREDGHGGLDNPLFIERMHAFISDPSNNVAFHCYFDVVAPDGNHQLSPGKAGNEQTAFPKSAAKFRALFSKQR